MLSDVVLLTRGIGKDSVEKTEYTFFPLQLIFIIFSFFLFDLYLGKSWIGGIGIWELDVQYLDGTGISHMETGPVCRPQCKQKRTFFRSFFFWVNKRDCHSAILPRILYYYYYFL